MPERLVVGVAWQVGGCLLLDVRIRDYCDSHLGVYALTTQSEFAALIGKHKSYVTRLKQAGRLVLTADGLVDVEKSKAMIAATADPSRNAAVEARAAPNRAGMEASSLADTSLPDVAPATNSRAHYKMLAVGYENKIVKLAMALERRLRYQREAARREPRVVGEMLRAAIERMIDQTAARLTVVRDSDQRRALIAAETRKIKRVVRVEFVRALRSMGKYRAEKAEQ